MGSHKLGLALSVEVAGGIAACALASDGRPRLFADAGEEGRLAHAAHHLLELTGADAVLCTLLVLETLVRSASHSASQPSLASAAPQPLLDARANPLLGGQRMGEELIGERTGEGKEPREGEDKPEPSPHFSPFANGLRQSPVATAAAPAP